MALFEIGQEMCEIGQLSRPTLLPGGRRRGSPCERLANAECEQ